MNTHKPWSVEDLKVLKKEYKRLTPTKLAKRLKRTRASVKQRLRFMSFTDYKQEPRFWTKNELKQLKKLAKNNNIDQLVKKMNRSKISLQLKLQRLGIEYSLKLHKWSAKEDATIKSNYDNMSVKDLAKLMKMPATLIRARIGKLRLEKRNRISLLKVGQKFGKLTVIKIGLKSKKRRNRQVVVCRCECGVVKKMLANSVKSGTESCGCLKAEMTRKALQKAAGHVSFMAKFFMYKGGAKSRGFDFLLPKSLFFDILQQDCYYCGAKPKLFSKYVDKNGRVKSEYRGVSKESLDRSWIKVNGVDRKDSSKGYTSKNCVPCCTKCNSLKNATPYDNFLDRIVAISKHLNLNNAPSHSMKKLSQRKLGASPLKRLGFS